LAVAGSAASWPPQPESTAIITQTSANTDRRKRGMSAYRHRRDFPTVRN
jgi:hypothetical protein